jgi:signal transduction histidine kinase
MQKHSETQIFNFSIVALSTVCHLTAFFQFRQIQYQFEDLTDLPEQIYFLLFASLLISFVILFSKKTLIILSLLIVKFVFFLLIGYPLGENFTIEISLLSALILEVIMKLPFLLNIVFVVISFILTILFQKSVIVWDIEMPQMSSQDVLSLTLYGFLIAVILVALKYLHQRLLDERRTTEQLDNAILKLTDTNIGFQQLAINADEESRVEERNRITREIHDSIGYILTNIIMMMEAAMRVPVGHSDELKNLHVHAREQAQQGLKETRYALRLLRSIERRDVYGLKAINRLVNAFQEATGVDVKVEYGNSPWKMGEKIDPVVYRIVQEGMTNSFRHGKANHIDIYFWQNDSELIINIHDNGIGCDDIQEGIGLSGMKERLEYINGALTLRSTENGFHLMVRIPFDKDNEASDEHNTGSVG